MPQRVVLDTNVLVAAGFNRSSSAARIIQGIEDGLLEMVWDNSTRAEQRKVLDEIPPLSWGRIEGLFLRRREFRGATCPGEFMMIRDHEDRKFAALAAAAGAVLISSDDHLLSVRKSLPVRVMSPKEFMDQAGL